MNQIPLLEHFFEIDVNIFTLNEDKSVTPIYKSVKLFSKNGEVMNLNLYDQHLSLIINLALYSKKYNCPECKKCFKTNFALNQHIPHCEQVEKYNYPGGYFNPGTHIFEKLKQFGCEVLKKQQHYPWFHDCF